VLRHTAFFIHRDTTTADDRFEMLKGLAFLQSECAGPIAGDYGEDVLGGSKRLREIKPFKRTPRWRAPARTEGPPATYDVALHLDFADQAGLDAYNDDDVHHRVGDYNASINEPELTARVDWWYDGPPRTQPGLVRHSAMFVWLDDADDGQKKRALDAVRGLESERGVDSVVIGENVGPLTTDYDWLYDIHLADREQAEALLNGDALAKAMEAVASTTKYEWTARLTHVMRGSAKLGSIGSWS
jgi:hypothetical protein